MNSQLKSNIENWFKRTVIEKKDSRSKWLLVFLFPFSFIFKLSSFFFHYAYDKNWCKQAAIDLPICSVGNIVLGGVGKTPVVLMLGKALEEKISLGIISRGYYSPLEKAKVPFLLSKDKGPVISATHAGDEPYLLASKLSKSRIVVGKDRIKGAKLCKQCGVDLIVLDDAMQHREIKRDFEIVVLDSQNLFGNAFHFPCGLLREHPKGLKRAHLLVCNHTEENQDMEALEARLKKFTDAPVIFTRYVIDSPFDYLTLNSTSIEGLPIALFAAIGNPFRFKTMIEKKGAQIVNTLFLHDHAPIDRKKLDNFAVQSKKLGAKILLVTEKDSVKINKNWQIALPIIVAPITVEIVKGETLWDEAINYLLSIALKENTNNWR